MKCLARSLTHISSSKIPVDKLESSVLVLPDHPSLTYPNVVYFVGDLVLTTNCEWLARMRGPRACSIHWNQQYVRHYLLGLYNTTF